MLDRLSELRRQRALLQEHLAWLDREIADAAAGRGDSAAAAPSPAPPAATGAVPASAPGIAADPPRESAPPAGPADSSAVKIEPDAILEQYRTPGGSLQSDVRKGCFLYFAAALVLLGAGVAALYFLISSR